MPPPRRLRLEPLEDRRMLALLPLGGDIPLGDGWSMPQSTFSQSPAAAVASDAMGNFALVWSVDGRDGDDWGVYAQCFGRDGAPRGDAFQVNTTTASAQKFAAIAMDDAGNFVVTWSSLWQDYGGYGVYAQRFDATGAAVGEEFRVNTYTVGNQNLSAAAMDADGDFVITWTSQDQDGSGTGVFAQRYDATGNRVGDEFRVNATTEGNQRYSSVAMDALGNFVVAWTGPDESGSGIFARRYATDGTPLGDEFAVNTTTAGTQQLAAIAANADGHFVIAWQGYDLEDETWSVYAQRYGPTGIALGDEIEVGRGRFPAVTIGAEDDFAVAWETYDPEQTQPSEVYAQHYDSLGTAWEEPLRVHNQSGDDQQSPSLVMGGDRLLLFWTSDASGYPATQAHLCEVTEPDTQGVAAEVVDRHVFYNNSYFDRPTSGNPGFSDATAVATDKVALLPGETARFANYTSSSLGINGVMVDVARLAGTPTVADFQFTVGNSSDPAAWDDPPPPEQIAVDAGAGVGGSDRVIITWADRAIVGQWLQVTVLATEQTGLAEPDVFCFGNAVGESGDSELDASVGAEDVLQTRSHPRGLLDPAPIDFAYDYNRDARVNATDVLIAQNHQTDVLDALKLISIPTDGAATSEQGGATAASATKSDGVVRREDWLLAVDEVYSQRPPDEERAPNASHLEKLLAVGY